MQCPQVSLQVEKKNAVLHFVMLSRCVITSTWQNAGSWSSHGSDAGPGEGEGGGNNEGGGGDGGGNGDSHGGGSEGEGGGNGDSDGGKGGSEGGIGDCREQYEQLSWHSSKNCSVLHFLSTSIKSISSRWQNAGSLSPHGCGESDGDAGGGGGDDGKGGSGGDGEGGSGGLSEGDGSGGVRVQ